MDLSKALEIFNVKDINKLYNNDIKKIYRKLMMKNHPDKGGSHDRAREINEAYSILKGLKSEVKAIIIEKKRDIIILSIEDLIKVYGGKAINVDKGGKSIEINRHTIYKFDVVIALDVDIEYNGITRTFNNLIEYSIRDEYSIHCIIYDNKLDGKKLVIKTYDKRLEVNISGRALSVVLKYPYNIKVRVNIERVLKNGHENS